MRGTPYKGHTLVHGPFNLPAGNTTRRRAREALVEGVRALSCPCELCVAEATGLPSDWFWMRHGTATYIVERGATI